MKRASVDVGLMFVAYNLRRIINIVGVKVLKKCLEELASFIFTIMAVLRHLTSRLRQINSSYRQIMVFPNYQPKYPIFENQLA